MLKNWDLLREQFPFDPRSKDDASIADVQALFGPAGLLDEFKNGSILPLVVEKNGRLVPPPGPATGATLSLASVAHTDPEGTATDNQYYSLIGANYQEIVSQ